LFGKSMAAKPAKGDLGLYSAWNRMGDLKPLEQLHGDAIQDKLRHMYMMTEGHWWSDRVELKSDILQRERLGGIANARGQAWPGNSVSWRFDQPGAAEQVAILLPGATRDHFKVIAYNSADVPLSATMTAWNVTAGRWGMRKIADNGAGETSELDLERSASTRLSFEPHVTTTLEFNLIRAGQPVEERPDLGIGADDVRLKGRQLSVTVHSLGAAAISGGVLRVEDASGNEHPVVRIGHRPQQLPRLSKAAHERGRRVRGSPRRQRLASRAREHHQGSGHRIGAGGAGGAQRAEEMIQSQVALHR